jgi:hypothetical protein
MNYMTQNSIGDGSQGGSVDSTLRMIARIPAPEGLEERVLTGVLRASRKGRVLAWPAALRPESAWMRTAAAAAIVFVVAGGGWGVYSRVEQPQPAKVIVMPPRVAAPGGFSTAEARRRPQTLDGPVLAHPTIAAPKQTKTPASPLQKQNRRVAPSPAATTAAQSVPPQAK